MRHLVARRRTSGTRRRQSAADQAQSGRSVPHVQATDRAVRDLRPIEPRPVVLCRKLGTATCLRLAETRACSTDRIAPPQGPPLPTEPAARLSWRHRPKVTRLRSPKLIRHPGRHPRQRAGSAPARTAFGTAVSTRGRSGAEAVPARRGRRPPGSAAGERTGTPAPADRPTDATPRAASGSQLPRR